MLVFCLVMRQFDQFAFKCEQNQISHPSFEAIERPPDAHLAPTISYQSADTPPNVIGL